MKKNKLKLEELVLDSFITALDSESVKTFNGGVQVLSVGLVSVSVTSVVSAVA